jgi:hypothetical protein
MARKKAGRPKKSAGQSIRAVAVRASAEYALWVEQFAEFNRTPVSGLVDQALAEFARIKGFKNPPGRT